MPGGGEPGHVGADLGEDHVRAGQADPGDLIQAGYRVGERGGLRGDPLVQGGDVGADRVDPAQHGAEQEGVVAGEVAGEGLFQHGDLGAHAAPGQLCQHLRVPLPGDQRGEHVPPGDPEDVGDDRAELDAGVFEQLLGLLLSAVGAANRSARYRVRSRSCGLAAAARSWTQHLPFGDLAQPDCVELVFSELRNDQGISGSGRCPRACKRVSWLAGWVAGVVTARPATSGKAGMPSWVLPWRRAVIWSIWASLCRAPARLTFSPSASPSQRAASASAIRAVRLPQISARRGRWAGSGRSSGQRGQD